uniref:Uncharacterized protein n=1 Tax=Noccaea caerulescens TaxID=107243 RepID=A0A1J3CTR3_NOCCA
MKVRLLHQTSQPAQGTWSGKRQTLKPNHSQKDQKKNLQELQLHNLQPSTVQIEQPELLVCLSTKQITGNQNSEWSESLNGDIHWNIYSFQARKSKCYISIVEDGNREKLFRSD